MSAKHDLLPVGGPSTAPANVRHVVFNPQARACLGCGVRRSSLFGVLDVAALEHIHGHIADLQVQPGQRLFSANDPGLAAFTLREGVVRMERMSERGERRIVRLAGRSDLIGLEALLGQTYSADAVACTPVKVCRLPRMMIDELAKDHAEMRRDLMKRWQAALDEAEEWLTELSAGSARWRMLRLLLKISEFSEPDGRVWLPSRQQMGAMLGMTVETASRLISALKREGVVLAADAGHARLAMPQLMAALRALSDEP
ncbi:Crp/Fnr family transcriptional regulator [Ideonella sp. DXS22W]|uniref:Crp/Fnr family transcriptional regulator n=1 Tax=Pseudaquabacterium inlustre TaxID=2984192 RepID=A0ABU9CL91_9BURK